MTNFQIIIDGQIVRGWTFASDKEAKIAEDEVSKFIQRHIEKEVISLFRWRFEEI